MLKKSQNNHTNLVEKKERKPTNTRRKSHFRIKLYVQRRKTSEFTQKEFIRVKKLRLESIVKK